MPEDVDGALVALTELAERGRDAATRSTGPRFFHFVMGGGTPEEVAIDWLRQLFELPKGFGGVFTTGATMANFVRPRRCAQLVGGAARRRC